MVRASVAAERAGVRTVSIVCQAFGGQAEAIAEAFGMKAIPLLRYPGVVNLDGDETLQGRVRGLVPDLLEQLSRTWQPDTAVDDPGPEEVVFAGTLDEIQEHFLLRGWSDGLPVMPPTLRAVRRSLQYTDREPHEVIGIVPPDNREATVWNVAVNGVMAGCRPEYMPVLLAVAEAIADPTFGVQHAGATPGWEPLVVVSGPIVDALRFNTGTGVLRAGRQANTSIGRFVRLFTRNVAGVRIPPGRTDKGTIGLPTMVALAENEEAVREMGWKTYAEDRGFGRNDSVVTLMSVQAVTPPIYSAGEDPQGHLDIISRVAGDVAETVTFAALLRGQLHALVVMSPSIARVLSGAGLSKDDVRAYIQQHSTTLVRDIYLHARQVGPSNFDLDACVLAGTAPRLYAGRSLDDHVPVFPWVGSIGVLVAGDAERNQSKALINNHRQGVPTSKRVILPRRWITETTEDVVTTGS